MHQPANSTLSNLSGAVLNPHTKYIAQSENPRLSYFGGARPPMRQCFSNLSGLNYAKFGQDISTQPRGEVTNHNFHGLVFRGGGFCTACFSELGSNLHHIWGEVRQSLAFPTQLLGFRHIVFVFDYTFVFLYLIAFITYSLCICFIYLLHDVRDQ